MSNTLETDALHECQSELNSLRQQIKMYYDFFGVISDALIIVNKDNKIVYVNNLACSLFMLREKELFHLNLDRFLQLVPKDILDYQTNMLIKEGVFTDEWTIKLADGTIKYVEYVATLDRLEEKRIYRIKDITTQKRKEQERNISVQMFADLFNQAVDNIVIYNKEGIIVDVNPSFCRTVGESKEHLAGKYIDEFVLSDYLNRWQEGKLEVDQEGSVKGEVVFTHSKGYTHYEYTTSTNMLNGLYMSIMRDVTEKLSIEKQLKKSERNFTDLFEQVLDAIVFWNKDGEILHVNHSAAKIFETDREDLIGLKLTDFVLTKDARYYFLLNELFEKKAIRAETFFLMPNGQRKLLEFTSRLHDEDDHIITIFRNVSEKYQMELQLRKSEQKFRKVFEDSIDGLILWDSSGKIADINESGLKILDIPQKMSARSVYDLINLQPENARNFEQYLNELNQNEFSSTIIPIHFKDGIIKHIEFSTRINTGLSLTVFRDVTERLEMQEQLRKSDTLNVVGELAAGIAHEIRNPMTALKGFIQLLQGSIQDDFSTYFRVITSELQRIETIITEFLVLAKPQAVKFLQRDINAILIETIELLTAQSLMQNIQFETCYNSEIENIYCEGNQLKQVFINIIKNAIEVMPNGGTIKVETDTYKEKYVCISISDQGQGIPEEKIKKLGEPFYTTKERGTGLGLMVSYKIIEEHKGWIDVESKLGSGTTFRIFLPLDGRRKGSL
ncbi:two-component system, sporulation sensor kinase E [Peribacillus deserti]|uniref:histidine kinase n=1 Tax=Peribacillus deserti TaxID=673318 RepID=A0ABS2QJ09_9BACI|nr:PAS domain-containing sensor histidine kinase [Peribacillus deserti]MBM7693114.1 two-component system, sporulation sensor kinase E [Peribacillus deserti]